MNRAHTQAENRKRVSRAHMWGGWRSRGTSVVLRESYML
jgi:hypothetical protein